MKKFVAILLAILMAFTCTTAIAAGAKSPTINDLYKWTPAYTWTEMVPAPTMESIAFAAEKLQYFLGADYELIDAFRLNVAYAYGIVHYDSPLLYPDEDYVMILTNEENTYFFTPILIENAPNTTAAFDFTNVEPAWYDCYLVHGNGVV